MYQRDIPRRPIVINRAQFVDEVFDLGQKYKHGCDTIMNAVEIGDYFVSFIGPRVPYMGPMTEGIMNSKLGMKELIQDLVPQEYSIELAHVVTIMAAKINEDKGYCYIIEAAIHTGRWRVRGGE